MLLDRININHLRIFEVVFKARSMTVAAQQLHLTQSGVSQHIKSLEEILGLKLFDRVKQRLVPTAQAEILYQQSVEGLAKIENGLIEIMSKESAIHGAVNVGIPQQFGHDVVLPLAAQLQRKYPGIRINFQVGLAPRMNDLILNGELDFAFVDEFITDRRVRAERVYNEDLELCISTELLEKLNGSPDILDKEFFEDLPYVEYEVGEPLLRTWFAQNLNGRHLKLNIRSYVEDAYCVSQLVLSGIGAGILPGALLLKLVREGNKIVAFQGSGRAIKSGISLASIRERSFTPSATLVMGYLRDAITKSQ